MTIMVIHQEHATVATCIGERESVLEAIMQIAHEREQTKPVTVYELVEIYRTGKCNT